MARRRHLADWRCPDEQRCVVDSPRRARQRGEKLWRAGKIRGLFSSPADKAPGYGSFAKALFPSDRSSQRTLFQRLRRSIDSTRRGRCDDSFGI